MPGGPIYHLPPYTADTAGNAFPHFYSGAGGNAAPVEFGLGVAASLGANATWQLRFPMPEVIPSGTLKLRLLGLANASTGDAKITVSEGTVAAGASPSAVTLTAEPQATVTWGVGDADKYKEVKISLSTTPASNDVLVVAVVFNNTGWTLAAVSAWQATIIWE